LLYISYNSTFCKISTGLKILPNKWNHKKQKLKSQSSKSTETNNILNNILEQAETTYLSLLDEGIYITNEVLKQRFKLNTTPIKKLNFFTFFEKHIETQKQLAKSTLSDYRQTLNTLIEFQRVTKYNVDFNSINLTFYDKLKTFILQNQGYSINTFGKRIKVIKTFMKDALDRKLHQNIDFQHKDFKTTEEVKRKMYLNVIDIKKLIVTEFQDKKLEEVRDVFLLICLLGIRLSDFHQLNKSNISKSDEGYTFNFQCQKTKNFQNIPIHLKGMEIIKKYQYILPKINENTINKNIKKIAELSGIDDEFTNTDGTFKKYEIITTKIGRISFATNAYLNTEMPKRSIMVITGHKKESSFDRYVQAQRPPKHKEVYKIYGDLN
jgi:site-specific recombinase XerD